MNIGRFRFLAFCFICVAGFSLLLAKDSLKDLEECDFSESFINNCDISSHHSRYTRSYHPFLLKKTRESFLQLEDFLSKKGFDIHGRLVVAGYQEGAIPGVYPAFAKSIIDDEADFRGIKGLSFAPANIFGFMTGFLLKDVSWIYSRLHPGKDPTFEHVLPGRVDLFDDQAIIFQKEAFGEDFDFVIRARDQLEKTLVSGDSKSTIKRLINFWRSIYAGVLKNSYNELVATQDILFSIDYARYALESSVPLLKFFVGPDITYPIEVFSLQKKEATEGAQNFVKRFQELLNPVENQSTVYIFCSFVDGVGKSTLLGNLQNWGKFGDSFEEYERVDNSSSQRGVLYKFKDDVFIMDLPAQISHFLCKPEGLVYVDIETVKSFSVDEKNRIRRHVESSCENYIDEFSEKIECAKGSDLSFNVSTNPADHYCKNVVSLGLDDVEWIPFSYNGGDFIFNKRTLKLRVLVSLEGAHSCGLKVVEPEQILFSGISIPMTLDSFLADITGKLKQAGIKKVMFVDFMGMYPRSSRENIRMHFILQQLKSMFSEVFKRNASLFQPFVNRYQELCLILEHQRDDFIKSFALETAFRQEMYDFILGHALSDISSMSVGDFQVVFFEKLKALLEKQEEKLVDQATTKVEQEYRRLLRTCKYDKDYHSLVRFSFDPLVVFSQYLANLFEGQVVDPYSNQLWSGFYDLFSQGYDNCLVEKQDYVVIDKINKWCRDATRLETIFSQLRANWYATCSNLLSWDIQPEQGNWMSPREKMYYVPPMGVLLEDEKKATVVQKYLEQCHSGDTRRMSFFHVDPLSLAGANWGEFGNVPHLLDWNAADTFTGLYAFGYNPKAPTNRKNTITRLVDSYQQDKRDKGYSNACMSTTKLCKALTKKRLWGRVSRELNRTNHNKKLLAKVKPNPFSMQLFVRTVATLEMLLKDKNSTVIVRKGNKKDFMAALVLLERITLPAYFGARHNGPLFDDYSQVEPVIPWEYLK